MLRSGISVLRSGVVTNRSPIFQGCVFSTSAESVEETILFRSANQAGNLRLMLGASLSQTMFFSLTSIDGLLNRGDELFLMSMSSPMWSLFGLGLSSGFLLMTRIVARSICGEIKLRGNKVYFRNHTALGNLQGEEISPTVVAFTRKKNFIIVKTPSYFRFLVDISPPSELPKGRSELEFHLQSVQIPDSLDSTLNPRDKTKEKYIDNKRRRRKKVRGKKKNEDST